MAGDQKNPRQIQRGAIPMDMNELLKCAFFECVFIAIQTLLIFSVIIGGSWLIQDIIFGGGFWH